MACLLPRSPISRDMPFAGFICLIPVFEVCYACCRGGADRERDNYLLSK